MSSSPVNNNNNNKQTVKGEASSLSRFQIAAFFFIGYFLLPLSPLWCVLSAFYQLCLVQGTLSSQARVITAVVCMFFGVALIPFLNIGFYFTYPPDLQNDISVRINGQVPLGLLTIFYAWGSVIGYRYYTIPASYEQERDRDSIRKLEQQELRPPLLVSRSIARAARGIDGKYSHEHEDDYFSGNNNSFGAGGNGPSNNDEHNDLPSGSPTSKQQAPINVMMTPEYQAGNFDTFAQFTAKNLEASSPLNNGTATSNTGTNFSPRGTVSFSAVASARRQTVVMNRSPYQQQQQQPSAATNDDDTMPDSAADMQNNANNNNNSGGNAAQHAQQYNFWLQQQQYANYLQDKVIVRNAYDLYCLLKEETGQGAGITMLIGLFLAAVTIATARIQEWQSKEGNIDPKFNTTLYNHEPIYSLSTVFFFSIFFVFYTTLAFVKHLYTQNIQLVYHLTFLGRGVGDLRADKEIFTEGIDDDDDDDNNDNSTEESSGMKSNQSMHYISASAFSTYESTVQDNSQQRHLHQASPTPANNQNDSYLGATTNYSRYDQNSKAPSTMSANNNTKPSSSSTQQQQKTLSGTAAKAVIVELLDPYNVTHLRAWEEVRKIAAEQISSPTSVLNSFFTPTVFISAFGGFGLGLYISVRVLFMQRTDDVGGPFFTAITALSVIFLIYLVLVYVSARETRGHFKAHETIVSRIAFDVARELEHSVRRSQLGLEYLGQDQQQQQDDQVAVVDVVGNNGNTRSSNNNNNNSPSNNNNAVNNNSIASGVGGNFVGLNQQQLQLIAQGKAHFFHEPPTTEAELTSLFDSVNSLCNMMSVVTPRPLFVGMEQRNVRYFLAYVLATCAILLFFALLTSMRNGFCRDNIRPLPEDTTTTPAPNASTTTGPGLFWAV